MTVPIPGFITGSSYNRDRFVVISGLFGVCILAWIYMIYLGSQMGGMDMQVAQIQRWGLVDFMFTFLMWAVMMIAMMTPSAAPMVLMFARINRQPQKQQTTYLATSAFLLGYLNVWFIFSLVATVVQLGLHELALLSPMLVSTSPLLGGGLLIAAGIFQFSSLKNTCLNHCRTPLAYLMNEWQEGYSGAFFMGMKHGSYCVGCCWLIMALLFVAGVMNLLWVATLAVYVLIEKLVPPGPGLARVIGLLSVFSGLWLVVV